MGMSLLLLRKKEHFYFDCSFLDHVIFRHNGIKKTERRFSGLQSRILAMKLGALSLYWNQKLKILVSLFCLASS